MCRWIRYAENTIVFRAQNLVKKKAKLLFVNRWKIESAEISVKYTRNTHTYIRTYTAYIYI